MNEGPEQEELVEQIRDWHGKNLTINTTDRIVQNVVLSGATSRNGHRYTEEALRDGAVFYVKKPVFLDHAQPGVKPQERSTRDLVGSITSARYEEGRIRGDIQVLNTEAGETFLKLVESNAPQVGMSHVVVVERGRDPKVVNAIREVISVDAVVYPATTTTFQEGTQRKEQEDRNNSSERVSRETEAVGEASLRLQNELDEAKAELEMLRENQKRFHESQLKVDQINQARREIDRMLRESRIPEAVITEGFRSLLQNEHSSERRAELIAERRELGRRWETSLPRSLERKGQNGHPDDKWMVDVLKGVRGRG